MLNIIPTQSLFKCGDLVVAVVHAPIRFRPLPSACMQGLQRHSIGSFWGVWHIQDFSFEDFRGKGRMASVWTWICWDLGVQCSQP